MKCSPVRVCKCAACDLVFNAAFPMKHLQPARCCALQIASKEGLHTRKGARLTSHLKKLGHSLTWLLRVLELAEIWASNLFHTWEFPPGKNDI